MKKFIPYPFYCNDMPVDISFVFDKEKPAGKHGFLQVKGDDFVFEDGTKGRFWGVNLNGGACFPEFEYSVKFAKRLAKTGVNLVRFHQLDAEWNAPNIFAFSKGKRLTDTMSFDCESIERLDYLVHCLKKEGIYLYLDVFTYRKFKSGDGVENAGVLGDAAKPYHYFDRVMIERQKELAKLLWSHVNPYTELAYRDDPAFVLTEIVNESDLFSKDITAEPYLSKLKKMFKEYLKEQNIDYDADSCNFKSDDAPVVEFKVKVQEDYYREMYGYMREIGVKIPITGTNWTIHTALLKSQLNTDFTDSHLYLYDWRWGEYEKKCYNKSVSESLDGELTHSLKMKAHGKPFFISEWDMTWPNEYRAESPLFYAAVASLQGWGGLAVHTYSYTTHLSEMKVLGKEVSSSTIGGIPYREGVFSVWNDPAKYGLFYHAALIMRRGDIRQSKNLYAYIAKGLDDKLLPLSCMSEVSRIGVAFDQKTCSGARIISDTSALTSGNELTSDTKELYRNREKKFGYIDTKKTKCAYGLLSKNSPIELNSLNIDCKSDFAVIALSTLTEKDIDKSDNILLSAIGRVTNSDMKIINDQMYDLGKPPVLAEVIEAEITLTTETEGLVVRGVNPEGCYTGIVPSVYEGGRLKFSIGKTMPSIYYLIQKE